MSILIEKNKGWLSFYSLASRIIGWTYIILNMLPVLFISFVVYDTIKTHKTLGIYWLPSTLECLFGQLPLGIILLGVAQLIKYICEDGYKLPWLLRHGTFLLYLFALLTFIQSLAQLFTQYWQMSHVTNFVEDFSSVTVITSYALPVLAKMLVLIGLGSFLKRVMPVIEEAKSLV